MILEVKFGTPLGFLSSLYSGYALVMVISLRIPRRHRVSHLPPILARWANGGRERTSLVD